MGSDDTQSPLARAYDLVEAGRYDEARAILEPILATDFENADAWWIYAHAVTEPDLGRDALENVLRLDPNYPGAAELLRQAESMSAPKAKAAPIAPVTMPETPAAMPEDDFSIADEAPAYTPRKKVAAQAAPAPRRSPFPLIAVVAVIVIALVLLVLLLQTNGTPTATPTQAAALATSTEASAAAVTEEPTQNTLPTEILPTEAPSVAPTLAGEQATVEATEIDYEGIGAALAGFPIAESGIGVVETSLGSTLMATACTEGGRAMRTLLPQVMNALAMQSPALGSDIQAVGVRMLDCTANTPFVIVASDLATAQSYAAGGISDADYAATWKPQ